MVQKLRSQRRIQPSNLHSRAGRSLEKHNRFQLKVKHSKEDCMGKSKEIRNVAIVGAGVIGASWAALYLARGLDVVATDPAPNAEANLRKYVDEAWEQLEEISLSAGASRDRLTFPKNMGQGLAHPDLVQEKG